MGRHSWHPTLLSILLFSLSVTATADELNGFINKDKSKLTMEERLAVQEARIAELEGLVNAQLTMISDARKELAALKVLTASSRVINSRETITESPARPLRAPATKPQTDFPAGWNNSHAFINSDDGEFTMQFAGRLHLDYRGYTNDGAPTSTMVMRRARISLEGQLFKNYEYKIQGDFADTNNRLLRAAYINAKFTEAVQLRFGQFKSPYSQETLQSSNRINFVDRSSLAALAPGPTPGVMLHGSFLNDVISYNIAATNSMGALKLDDDGTPEVMGRLRFQPFQSSELLKNFAFGGAYGQGTRSAGLSFKGRTASRSVTFFKSLPVKGKISRGNAEFEWVLPKFSIRGEFDRTKQAREGLADGGGNLSSVIAKGFMFDAAYVFGGETQSNSAILPNSNFLQDGGLGAFQFVFRYENLHIDDGLDPNRGEAYTIGFNWWLSKFLRHQSNFAFERFLHSERTGSFNANKAFTYLSRIQLTF